MSMRRNILGFLLVMAIVVEGFLVVGDQKDVLFGKLLGQAGSAISMSAVILPNPFNTLAEQLQNKSKELAQREAVLITEENQLKKNSEKTTQYIPIGGVALLILFLTHLYFDYRQRR